MWSQCVAVRDDRGQGSLEVGVENGLCRGKVRDGVGGGEDEVEVVRGRGFVDKGATGEVRLWRG